ncbi:MAG TPA: hypothetical protein VMO88_11500, partial [Acidimicrobiales bacterium]|nr:hypothetical protein [Acidimicrobiales bacterium]
MKLDVLTARTQVLAATALALSVGLERARIRRARRTTMAQPPTELASEMRSRSEQVAARAGPWGAWGAQWQRAVPLEPSRRMAAGAGL